MNDNSANGIPQNRVGTISLIISHYHPVQGVAHMEYLSPDWPLPPLKKMRGIWYFRAPGHPLAGKAPNSGFFGWVRESRHVASVKIGRWLTSSELVSFQDGNLDNLDPANLEVVTRSEFQRNVSNKSAKVPLVCPVCGNTFFETASHAIFRRTCSPECLAKWVRRFDPDPDELAHLVWEESTLSLAKAFGVSDKAISKRCLRLGISKSPRGYWRLIELGETHERALLRLGWKKDQIEALDKKLDR